MLFFEIAERGLGALGELAPVMQVLGEDAAQVRVTAAETLSCYGMRSADEGAALAIDTARSHVI